RRSRRRSWSSRRRTRARSRSMRESRSRRCLRSKEIMAKVILKEMNPDERCEYMRELGRRRAQAFTPEYQRAARRKVSSESCRRNGAKGARRTIELHGYKALFEGCRRKRLAKPSPCELVMIGLLKTLGLHFKREYWLGDTLYTLDFYLPACR